MRCLIVIALCFVMASANYANKNRFQRLLRGYQNQGRYQNQDRYQTQGRDQNQDYERYQDEDEERYQPNRGYENENQYDRKNLLGSDDVDDYINDYVREIRRERTSDRDQCPRDIDENENDEYGREQGYETEQDYETYGRQGRGRRGLETEDDETTFGRQGRGRGLKTEDDETTFGRQGRGRQGLETEDYETYGRHGRQQQGRGQNRYSHLFDQEEDQDQDEDREGEYSPLSESIKEVKDANVRLATRLYKQSKDEKDDKNTVVSPLSIQLALAALNNGARGNTKKQIARVIAGRLQKRERKQVFRTLVRHLKGLGQNEHSSRQGQVTKIQPVTGIFITKTTRAQQMFVQTVKRNLGANVKQCDFQRQAQQCRQQINRFISQKTQGKINQIVPQDAITDNTKMILVNTLQLKAQWGPQMRRHVTKEAKFYPLDTKKVKIVEVLETKGRFKYYEDELVKIVGIPTERKELTLYVIVPKDKDGLTDVEKMHLQDSVQLKQLLKDTDKHVRHVGVQLPKFQIKHKIDVRRTLRKQGVTDAFDPQRADFSGITGGNRFEQDEEEQYGEQSNRRNPFLSSRRNRNFEDEETTTGQQNENKLHLNKFIHQTTITINENGITAQTGSGGPFEGENENRRYGRQSQRDLENEEMNPFERMTGFNNRRRESSGQEQQQVKANRAFAFVVKHNPTGQLVLVGRVIDAAQKKVNHVQQTINNVDQL